MSDSGSEAIVGGGPHTEIRVDGDVGRVGERNGGRNDTNSRREVSVGGGPQTEIRVDGDVGRVCESNGVRNDTNGGNHDGLRRSGVIAWFVALFAAVTGGGGVRAGRDGDGRNDRGGALARCFSCWNGLRRSRVVAWFVALFAAVTGGGGVRAGGDGDGRNGRGGNGGEGGNPGGGVGEGGRNPSSLSTLFSRRRHVVDEERHLLASPLAVDSPATPNFFTRCFEGCFGCFGSLLAGCFGLGGANQNLPAAAGANGGANGGKWKTFVDEANDTIRWLVGTIIMFVPAKFLASVLSTKLLLDFASGQAKFSDVFIPTILVYVGLYISSTTFKTKALAVVFQVSALLAGVATVATILYYAGYNSFDHWTARIALGFIVVVGSLKVVCDCIIFPGR